MSFIRQQRAQPGYDPNTHHCICGLDADLIMLGLATHEPHFSVLREVVTFDRQTCRTCGREGHFAADCPSTRGEATEEEGPRPPTPYQFLHLYALREYLDMEFNNVTLPFGYDLERVVDDFVFMCFFVGNDFLPHMPTLEIREGAIELLMSLYKKILPSLDGNSLPSFETLSLALSPLTHSHSHSHFITHTLSLVRH
jgi:5'-3' exoribonuclease 2